MVYGYQNYIGLFSWCCGAFFSVLSRSLSYYCVWCIPSGIVTHWYCDHCIGARASWLLCFCLVCGMCIVHRELFAFPLCIIGRLCFVIVALLGYFLYYSCNPGFNHGIEILIFSHTHVYGIQKSLCFLVSGKIDPISVPMWDKDCYIRDSSHAMLVYTRRH